MLKKLSIIYNFKPLAFDRTIALLNKLGISLKITQPLAIAGIFKFEICNNNEAKLRKAVGFLN